LRYLKAPSLGVAALRNSFEIDREKHQSIAPLLDQIAAALGKSKSTFFDSDDEIVQLRDACELLKLWSSINSSADRRELLAFASSLAKKS
jgi:hypothetical protein